MGWSKKACILAVFSLLLVSVSLVSCKQLGDRMGDAAANKFIDKVTGTKSTENSDVDKPISVNLIVTLKVINKPTYNPAYPCQVDFRAEQIITRPSNQDVGIGISGGDDFYTNKSTNSEGLATATFLFKRIYLGDSIELSFWPHGGYNQKVWFDYQKALEGRQLSKDSYEVSYYNVVFGH
ncbi:MAG: hypothetical protein NTV42_10080 [Chloroflexi bacterium]|nr:hypothetical protein [Chloroflexota bacterium]